MRFSSGKVKFVAVDEPSSALDPEGEVDLFKNLREVRQGKTMVFVTHRFGHLTKYADLIMYVHYPTFASACSSIGLPSCMKNGRVVESGTHQELMELGGEYSHLYNIQANAFEVRSFAGLLFFDNDYNSFEGQNLSGS